MSSILYYSNYCPHSKKIIGALSKTVSKDDVYFACIDNREKNGGRINVILQNGQKLIIPPHVNKVPALFLIKEDGRVIYGGEINKYFKPKNDYLNAVATDNNGEPLAFSFYEMGNHMSDMYAYLDLSPEEMSAKGGGGMRQMHHFALLDHCSKINTPEEDYQPDKVGAVDMGKLEAKRAKEIKAV